MEPDKKCLEEALRRGDFLDVISHIRRAAGTVPLDLKILEKQAYRTGLSETLLKVHNSSNPVENVFLSELAVAYSELWKGCIAEDALRIISFIEDLASRENARVPDEVTELRTALYQTA